MTKLLPQTIDQESGEWWGIWEAALKDSDGVLVVKTKAYEQKLAYGLWKKAEALCADLPPDCECSWVPAHGRHPEWDAERPAAIARAWRELNDIADTAASTEAANRWEEVARPFADAEATARATADTVLTRLLRSEAAWTSKWFD